MREFWNGVGTKKTLEAVRPRLARAGTRRGRSFVRTNWNQGTINQYEIWDVDPATRPRWGANAEVELGAPLPVTSQVEKVAAKYVTFTPGQGVETMIYRKNGALERIRMPGCRRS